MTRIGWYNDERKQGVRIAEAVSKMIEPAAVPETLKQDIDRAVQILTEEGCTEVFLFGSAVTGTIHAESDIDLAVRGCPQGRFFYVLGKLLVELDHSVDLVNLDSQDPFAQYLQQKGEMLQVGRKNS